MKSLKEKYWHKAFEFGIILKAINGILEIVGGLLVLTINKSFFTTSLLSFTRGELLEDPNDKIIGYITHALQNLSSDTKIFAAIYVLSHGILNVFLAVQLFRERLWAYLVSISFMAVFISYQTYRILHTHSIPLAVITIIDLVFVAITWHEYQYRLRIKK